MKGSQIFAGVAPALFLATTGLAQASTSLYMTTTTRIHSPIVYITVKPGQATEASQSSSLPLPWVNTALSYETLHLTSSFTSTTTSYVTQDATTTYIDVVPSINASPSSASIQSGCEVPGPSIPTNQTSPLVITVTVYPVAATVNDLAPTSIYYSCASGVIVTGFCTMPASTPGSAMNFSAFAYPTGWSAPIRSTLANNQKAPGNTAENTQTVPHAVSGTAGIIVHSSHGPTARTTTKFSSSAAGRLVPYSLFAVLARLMLVTGGVHAHESDVKSNIRDLQAHFYPFSTPLKGPLPHATSTPPTSNDREGAFYILPIPVGQPFPHGTRAPGMIDALAERFYPFPTPINGPLPHATSTPHVVDGLNQRSYSSSAPVDKPLLHATKAPSSAGLEEADNLLVLMLNDTVATVVADTTIPTFSSTSTTTITRTVFPPDTSVTLSKPVLHTPSNITSVPVTDSLLSSLSTPLGTYTTWWGWGRNESVTLLSTIAEPANASTAVVTSTSTSLVTSVILITSTDHTTATATVATSTVTRSFSASATGTGAATSPGVRNAHLPGWLAWDSFNTVAWGLMTVMLIYLATLLDKLAVNQQTLLSNDETIKASFKSINQVLGKLQHLEE